MSLKNRRTNFASNLLAVNLVVIFFLIFSKTGFSYPFATYVMDARNGKMLHSQNAEKKLNPASLTKMMTLYIVFHEVESKRLKLDQRVSISRNAAREPPSKFGYKVGQKISIRYLIRAAAIRSANDAATALAEVVSGSEKKFGEYMSRVAKAMGMENTNFKNANGLTETGHFSTAKDMAILSRRLIYDFPDYYHLFGKSRVTAAGKTLYNTNRKFLAQYSGADGIKTGFTSASGYNLAASAKRGPKRVIAIVFGGGSVALRSKRMTELLDIGFARAPKVVNHSSLRKLNFDAQIRNSNRNLGAVYFSDAPLKRPVEFLMSGLLESSVINELIEDVLVESQSQISKIEISADLEPPLRRPASFYPAKIHKETVDNDDKLIRKLIDVLKSGNTKMSYDILVGSYFTTYNARRDLSRLTLSDLETLSSVEKDISEGVVNKKLVYRVTFKGMSKEDAVKACQRLNARNELCEVIESKK